MRLANYLNEAPGDALLTSKQLNMLKKKAKADKISQTDWDTDSNDWYGDFKISQVSLNFDQAIARKEMDSRVQNIVSDIEKIYSGYKVDIGGSMYNKSKSSAFISIVKQLPRKKKGVRDE